MAKSDEKSRVRAEAYEALGKYFSDKVDIDLLKKGLVDPSYLVVGAALESMEKVNKEEALNAAADLEKLDNNTINLTIAQMYSKESDPKYNDFYIQQLSKMEGFAKYPLMISYQEYLSNQNDQVLMQGIDEFYKIASEENSWFMRMGGINALSQIKKQQAEEAKALDKQISEISDPAATVELKKKWEKANSISSKINEMFKELAEKEESDRLKGRIEGEID